MAVKMLKVLLLFFPALLYAMAIKLRHKLFDWGWMKSTRSPVFSLCIGNLEVGGTGKTPHTAFFTELLINKHKVAILLRGYGRKTKGFILAKQNATATEIGDEALTYAQRWESVSVAVCEKRMEGVRKLQETVHPDVVILDDAMQHRSITPDKTILLTRYSNLFTEDLPLPAGRLRDLPSRAAAADAVVVSKCPKELSDAQMDKITSQILPYSKAPVFFSSFGYAPILKNKSYLLVTGIAQTEELTCHLHDEGHSFEHFVFKDHHFYAQKDIRRMTERLKNSKAEAILTTQKDYAKLSALLPRTIPVEIVEISIVWLRPPSDWLDWLAVNSAKQEF